MIDEQKLYEMLKDFDPAVGERMEKHFRDGAFYFDLGGSSYPLSLIHILRRTRLCSLYHR